MSFNCGDVIMKCKPFVHTLNINQKSIRCDFCFVLNDSLMKCSNCKSMYYCDKKCQKRDWIECHRNECRIITKFGHQFDKDFHRFLLRLWLLSESTERQSETHELYNGIKKSFNDLMTHYNEIREDMIRVKSFDDFCHLLNSCDLNFDSEKLFILFSKICINSFSILNDDLNPIGSGIYICGSVLNHSCQPNASTVFTGIDLEVRSIKQINSNEEIFINYIDLKYDRNQRLTKLREQYYFECNCDKCLTHSDSNIDYSLVKSLDEEFDRLITEQNDWNKCYSIGIQTLPIYLKIYGDFHPDLTVQLMRILKVKALIDQSLSEKSTLELIRRTQTSIKITHGLNHKICVIFKNLIGL